MRFCPRIVAAVLMMTASLQGVVIGDEPASVADTSAEQRLSPQELMTARGFVRYRGMWRTVQEIELIERAIRNSSKSRDIVLDLFGGSGTTLIAAERTGRSARLLELDPKYVDVIVERWQNLTGEFAVLDGEDRTYDDLRVARERKSKDSA